MVSFFRPGIGAPFADRIVLIKADGLPFDLVDRLVHQKDPTTGKSLLPWFDHVFYRNGSRLSNFYSRGLTLSAPSWAILDTGQHSVIKGNVEFDRLTLASYDYLNIFSFVLKNSTRRETDTIAAKVLDEFDLPLISDSYSPSARFKTIQIVARDLQPVSLAGGLKRLLTLQNPKAWLDEWTIGLKSEDILFEILEKELIGKLRDPNVRYFDFLVPHFDHTAHMHREPQAQLLALKKIDDSVGRIFQAIQESPLAAKTALVLVSDHGMNTDPAVFSQGFNLVDFFAGEAGGRHHVLTNREPLGAFTLKALSPTVPAAITASPASAYLKGQASDYPTVALDADGNERASVYLRQSDLNLLQILWQQLVRKDLPIDVRWAATDAFFVTVDRNRPRWNALLKQLEQELSAIRRTSKTSGKPDEFQYEAYIRSLNNLLSLEREKFVASRYKVEDLIPKKALGETNSVHELQNYIIGLGPQGLVVQNGSLDMSKSFSRIDYFTALREARAKNNVQSSVSSHPVDFIAFRLPSGLLKERLSDSEIETAIWLFTDDENQALVLGRNNSQGRSELKYVPIRHLTQLENGDVHFALADWHEDLPLNVWRDLALPADRRMQWLEQWHTETEWLRALHQSVYSNAIINLHETFGDYTGAAGSVTTNDDDQALIRRYRERKRKVSQPDFIVFANNHWNFNFRGFNPGGNHGSFFRASTHATLMIAGGNETGIPKGKLIEEPYDALSFAPTILRLAGKLQPGHWPGPAITELFGED
jgi:hypothetical protein